MSVWTSKLLSILKHGVENRGDEDWVVEFGKLSFEATEATVELEVPRLETVEAAFFTPAQASMDGTAAGAGEYQMGTDGVITTGAITVCRGGYTNEGAMDAWYVVIGKPVEA